MCLSEIPTFLQVRVYSLDAVHTAVRPSRTTAPPLSGSIDPKKPPEDRDPSLRSALLAVELFPGTQQDVCFVPLLSTATLSLPNLAVAMAFSRPSRYEELGWSQVSSSASVAPGALVYGPAASSVAGTGVITLGGDRGSASPLQVSVDRSFCGKAIAGVALAPDGSILKDDNTELMRLNIISAVHPRFWARAFESVKVGN